MSPVLAIYLSRYLVNHISQKDLKEKILQENLVPSNIKIVQILDGYIKELLVEKRKSYTPKHEKVLKGTRTGKDYGSFLAINQIMAYYERKKKSDSEK